MRSRTAVLALIAALLAPAAPRAAERASLAGTFNLLERQGDDIDAAIEGAVAGMSVVARPFARRRLRAINTPYPRLSIDATTDAVVVVADPRAPIRTPAGGEPIPWRREDGETFDVRGEWRDGAFEQTFVSGSGRRVNLYRLSPDGRRLDLRVEISGGGLPSPMSYRLVYERAM